ncbi:helix-turn-helix domain-containing protein [Crossiella sp. SN42]|uniref:helix-turn-helix domain-containing protein n=1 Tax=Crossiella sp. SN42 TaxID=2944808 RepID=UPI00207C4589|nr:helix-turn-helix domain-containing protein [Crossiella sp. SN42]MCO1575169.1 helix-turn-helix domain-containing protein [Crossiella sp. SN42]
MSSVHLRAAESRSTEIERLWDGGLTGRQIGDELGLNTRAVNQVLRVMRTAPPRRTWTWLVGPRRIAAIAWLQQRRQTISVSDLVRITGRSRGSIRQCLKEDLNQWSDEEIARALEQFPDPFDLAAVSAEEREAWGQVAQHETTLANGPSTRHPTFPCPSSGLAEKDHHAVVPGQQQLRLDNAVEAGAARTQPHAEMGSATITRRPIDVAVFSTEASPVRLSREDQVRCALTAWHLRRERHFTTAEVAFILGRSPSVIGHCVRALSAHTRPSLKGDHRARAAETCKQLLAAGYEICRIAITLGRSHETVRRLLREAGAITRPSRGNDRPATPDTVASPSAELP